MSEGAWPCDQISQQWWYRYSACKVVHSTDFYVWEGPFQWNTLCGNPVTQAEPFPLNFSVLPFNKNALDYAVKDLLSGITLPTSLLVLPSNEEQLKNTAQQPNTSFYACASLGIDCWATAMGRIGELPPPETAIPHLWIRHFIKDSLILQFEYTYKDRRD